jgi:hypothetical protein
MSGTQNGEKTYILGDKVEDTLLISRQKKYNNLRSAVIQEMHKTNGGTQTLSNLLKEMKIESEFLYSDNPAKVARTLSEWVEKEVSIQGKTVKRVFLEKRSGFYVDSDEKTNEKPLEEKMADAVNKLENCKLAAIHDICYSTPHLENYLAALKKNVQQKHVLFRTKFYTVTNSKTFFSQFCTDVDLVKQTILLFDVNDLRPVFSSIQKGVSWEQLTTQTLSSLKHISKLGGNIEHRDFKAIVVCFNQEGCLVYSKDGVKLFFYPDEIEGDSVLTHKKDIFSIVTVMQASLTLALSKATPDMPVNEFNKLLCKGVKIGLVSMRHLANIGFTEKAEFPSSEIATNIKNCFEEYDTSKSEIYPIECIVSEKNSGKFSITRTVLENDTLWENEREPTSPDSKVRDRLVSICKEIVCNGKPCHNIPYLRYKELITYDSFEIEQYRNIHRLFSSYIYNTKLKEPLSICVFGSPGSGKSFAVEQIAGSIADMTPLVFNVSQMKEPEDLAVAFHQISDTNLEGKFPIVFFDEFDSKLNSEQLGWLKYFLAPMQDGKFTEDGFSHLFGRAIFIFAGGTCTSMAELIKKADTFIDAKVKDFISRLRGHVNIFGPNCQCPHGIEHSKVNNCSMCDSQKFGCNDVTPSCWNHSYMLRRAALLRSNLEKKLCVEKDAKIEIADNVFEAFMKVDEYLYGVRSLKAIVQTSNITANQVFSASCINTAYLRMHVDKTFNDLLEGPQEGNKK